MKRTFRRRLLVALAWLGGALAGLYLAIAAAVAIYSFARDDEPAEAALVLGAAVWGPRPSPVLEERVKHAIDLYRSGRVKKILFTGGHGRGDRRAEAVVAKSYAEARGVPGADLLCEAVSRSTEENLLAARAVLRRAGIRRVLLVSDPLHMRRAVTLARDLGLEAGPSPTPSTRFTGWRSRLRFLARETSYLATYLVRRPFRGLPEAPFEVENPPPC